MKIFKRTAAEGGKKQRHEHRRPKAEKRSDAPSVSAVVRDLFPSIPAQFLTTSDYRKSPLFRQLGLYKR